MGGQTGVMSTWVSFLLFPHPSHVVGCGWVEHEPEILSLIVV